jgi:hypothetical protein
MWRSYQPGLFFSEALWKREVKKPNMVVHTEVGSVGGFCGSPEGLEHGVTRSGGCVVLVERKVRSVHTRAP